MSINFSAMILAAGFGKRMMPLTKKIPKPLIDINGITLLENSINFLKKLGCNQIIVNTHYKHKKIYDAISRIKENQNIELLYEKTILDTAGGVKNALPLFKNKNLIIVNSDIFWQNENLNDVKKLINKYKINYKPHLLLLETINANGLDKAYGDFVLNNNNILRYSYEDKILFYSGLQILNSSIIKRFNEKIFSFNVVWDYLIKNNNLKGVIMKSQWYHVGDMQGLKIARKLDT